MNFKVVAKEILKGIGGNENINHATHCITRLRLTLKDESKVDEEYLKQISGVIGVIVKGGQYQIVIGNEVENVYKEFIALAGINSPNNNEENITKDKKKFKVMDIFDTIAGLFTPILPVLTAAGMIQAILVAGVAFNWIDNTSSTYYVLAKVANAGFYFLPMMLAYTTAAKFKCNQFLAVMLAGVLLHPGLMSSGYSDTFDSLTFLGVGIKSVNYTSSVLPIILTVILMSYVEKFADRISPTSIKFFSKPLLTILICAPISLIALGPLGYTVGEYVAQGINFLGTNVGFLSTAIMGAFYPLFVMTGMHHAYAPIALASLASLGYEGVMSPAGLCANMAQGGSALAISIRTKNKNLKALASTGGFTCILGVSEPVMYGVTLKNRSALISTMIGGASGGLFAGLFGVKAIAMASPGLASLPVFFGTAFVYAVIAILIAFVVAFIISFVTFKENIESNYDNNTSNRVEGVTI